MLISMVVAASDNSVIGDKNTLLWKLPADFARMKELTMGKPLIMGRKTHESIGRVLPGRRNVVITSDISRVMEGADAVRSLDEAISFVRGLGTEEAIIFGGGEIYRLALPITDRIYMTRVHADVSGDTTFPELPKKDWKIVSSIDHPIDDQHAVSFTFEEYHRVR